MSRLQRVIAAVLIAVGVPVAAYVAWFYLGLWHWALVELPQETQAKILASPTGFPDQTVENALDEQVAQDNGTLHCSPGEWTLHCEMDGRRGRFVYRWDLNGDTITPLNGVTVTLYKPGYLNARVVASHRWMRCASGGQFPGDICPPHQ